MLSGLALLVVFVLMVIIMIVAISKWKIHPFLSIMGVSLLLALVALPLGDIPGTIGAGFSGTFSSLGIVIILGAISPAPSAPASPARSPRWASSSSSVR